MKRMMLATTAVLTLSTAAFAQSQTEAVAIDALVANGYNASAVNELSDAEVTELYIAATSGEANEIRTVIDGFELTGDVASSVFYDTEYPNDAAEIADQALMQAGYPEGTISLLTDEEVTLLYLAATGEDSNDLITVIDGFDFGVKDAPETINTGAESFVVATLMDRGYAMDDVMSLTDAELAELYIALTSEDENQIRQAITSALS